MASDAEKNVGTSQQSNHAANGNGEASENGKKAKVDKRKARKKQQKLNRREIW